MNPLYKVNTKWSSNLAYAIGLIATDGCLYNDGRHINFTSKDKCLVETFRDCLGIDNKIALKNSGYSGEKKYSYIQFGDVNFYRWLNDLGLFSNKSKTISQLNIPDKYFMDFLRGHFDGDGSFYSYWDERWPNSFMFYTTFVSASPLHIHWLREMLGKLLKIQGSINKSRGICSLRFAKRESRILLPKIYYKTPLPCLERKREKVKKCVKIL